MSAVASQRTDIPGYSDGRFIQYVADNVDHNIRTIDGHNTFHGMGIIAAVTPDIKSCTPVARISVTPEKVAATGRIGGETAVDYSSWCINPLKT